MVDALQRRHGGCETGPEKTVTLLLLAFTYAFVHPASLRRRRTDLAAEPVCKVKWCRFPRGHTTSGHQCGTCGNFGHGQMECHKFEAKRDLFNMYCSDEMPVGNRCSLPGCKFSLHHCAMAHQCGNCGEFGHISSECKQRQDAARPQAANDKCGIEDAWWS